MNAEALEAWGAAEEVWIDAIKLAPKHPEIALKKTRLECYYPFPLAPASLAAISAVEEGGIKKNPRQTKINGRASVTVNTTQHVTPVASDFEAYRLSRGRWAFRSLAPVIEAILCDEIVAAAEARALVMGGWNTARHYSVPTTGVMHIHLI